MARIHGCCDYARFDWLKRKILLALRSREESREAVWTVACVDFNATLTTATLMSKAGGEENSEMGYSGYGSEGRGVHAGIYNFDRGLVDRGIVISIAVNPSVVFETELLRNSEPFQGCLASHRVLALLLLGLFVVELCAFLYVLLA